MSIYQQEVLGTGGPEIELRSWDQVKNKKKSPCVLRARSHHVGGGSYGREGRLKQAAQLINKILKTKTNKTYDLLLSMGRIWKTKFFHPCIHSTLIECPHLPASNGTSLRLERQDSGVCSVWAQTRSHRFKIGAK